MRSVHGVEFKRMPPTERMGAGYHPVDGSILTRWVCMQSPADTRRQEFFPCYDARLEHLARFLSKENGLIQLRFPRQLYVLALCVESNSASQAAVMVDGEGERCAWIPG